VRIKREELRNPDPRGQEEAVVSDPIIGRRQFADGQTRDVYLDVTGQYILGDDGRMVRGEWVLTDQEDEADVPGVVEAAPDKLSLQSISSR
jgi:hypothetical protein